MTAAWQDHDSEGGLILCHEDLIRCVAIGGGQGAATQADWHVSLFVAAGASSIEAAGEVARSEFAAGVPGTQDLLLLRLGDPSQTIAVPGGHRAVTDVVEAALAGRWTAGTSSTAVLGLGPGIPEQAHAALRKILEGHGRLPVATHSTAVLAVAGLADHGVVPIGHRVLVLEAAFGNAYLSLVTVGPPPQAKRTPVTVEGAGALPIVSPLADLLMAAAVQQAGGVPVNPELERAKLLSAAARLAPTFEHGRLEATVVVSNTQPMRVTVREDQVHAKAAERRLELEASLRTLVREHQVDDLVLGLGMRATEAECRGWLALVGTGRVHLLGEDGARILAEGAGVMLAPERPREPGQLQASVLSVSRNTVMVRLASGEDALLEGPGTGTGLNPAGWLRPGAPLVVQLESGVPMRVSPVSPPRSVRPRRTAAAMREGARIVARLDGHNGPVMELTCSPDGARIISAGQDGTIRLWDSRTAVLDRVLAAHTSWVSALACSAGHGLLASGGKDRTIRIWDLGTGLPLTTLVTHRAWVQALVFSPDGAVLYGGAADGEILRWQVSAGGQPEVLAREPKEKRAIRRMTYLAAAGALVLTGRDHAVRLVRVADPAGTVATPSFLGHGAAVRGLAASLDGHAVLTGDASGLLHHWRVPDWHPRVLAPAGHAGVEAVAVAPTGHWAVSGHTAGEVRRWDLERGAMTASIQVHDGPVTGITLLPMEGRLATGGLDGSVTLMEVVEPPPISAPAGFP